MVQVVASPAGKTTITITAGTGQSGSNPTAQVGVNNNVSIVVPLGSTTIEVDGQYTHDGGSSSPSDAGPRSPLGSDSSPIPMGALGTGSSPESTPSSPLHENLLAEMIAVSVTDVPSVVPAFATVHSRHANQSLSRLLSSIGDEFQDALQDLNEEQLVMAFFSAFNKAKFTETVNELRTPIKKGT